MKKYTKMLFLLSLLAVFALAITACAGEAGPQGEQGPPGEPGAQGEPGPPGEAAMFAAEDVTCTECHNSGTGLIGVAKQWEESGHATGTAYARGASASCAGCHSSAGFSARVAAGLSPSEVESGDTHPVGPNCRTCHQIHETYSAADWALETTDPVAFYAPGLEGVTYDGGEGNLCAACHQPRRTMVVGDDGNVEITNTHFGPHPSAQAGVLMGAGGELVEGSPGAHATMVEDGCVTCHMGENINHTFEPQDSACEACHTSEDFDYTEAQAEVEALAEELHELLVANGLWNEEDDENMEGVFPADQAGALWNYAFLIHEDGSMGVHNMSYVKELLEASIAVFE